MNFAVLPVGNLAESFETNPSVDVSYADAATGARQIKLLGLGRNICADADGKSIRISVEQLPYTAWIMFRVPGWKVSRSPKEPLP